VPNKLLIIKETKQTEHALEIFAPKFWHQLPQNKNQKDQSIRAAWYNIDLDSWNPGILDVPSSTGDLVGVNTYQIEFKVPSPRPIVMFDHDHPEYLKRLEYCKEVGITVSTTEITVDSYWISHK
jgi:hypothetical protein